MHLPLTLMNGEIYIQGGRIGGEEFPEVRERDGDYRLLSNVPTSQYNCYYPRNYIAPDGRVFGFDINGLMYFVTTEGTGSITSGRPNRHRPGWDGLRRLRCIRPGRILQISGERTGARLRSTSMAQTPVMAADRLLVFEARMGDGDGAAERARARDRWQRAARRTRRRQQQRRDLESGHGAMVGGRERLAAATLPFFSSTAAGCIGPGRRRWRERRLAAQQLPRRNLLPALSVRCIG